MIFYSAWRDCFHNLIYYKNFICSKALDLCMAYFKGAGRKFSSLLCYDHVMITPSCDAFVHRCDIRVIFRTKAVYVKFCGQNLHKIFRSDFSERSFSTV